MGMLKEFKDFAMRGNVIDLAVGVIIGGAFGKIISSLVADLIMPPVGLMVGGVNFTDLKWVLKGPEIVNGVKKAAVTWNYGNFLQVTLDFVIVAFCVFLFVKGINSLSKKKEEVPASLSKEEQLLTEIRDLLKKWIETASVKNTLMTFFHVLRVFLSYFSLPSSGKNTLFIDFYLYHRSQTLYLCSIIYKTI